MMQSPVCRVVLDDGTVLAIRGIEPSDRDALRAAFRRLSPASRYQRFHAHLSDLREPMLDYLTRVDGIDHFAVVALAGAERRRRPPKIVGIARLIRLDARTAEVAVTVADDHQGVGLGVHFMEILLDHARRTDVDTLVAHVLPTNRAMLRLLEKTTEALRSTSVDTFVARVPRVRGSVVGSSALM